MKLAKTIHMAVLLAVLALALNLLSCTSSEDLVAKVGSTRITLQDLREEMIRSNRNDPQEAARLPLDNRQQALDLMVERELKLQLARKAGYYEREEFLNRFDRLMRHALIQELHERAIIRKVIDEDRIRDTYERQGTEVQASHILISWTDDSTAVRERAREIRSEIESGLDFDEAVVKYTEEPGGADRQGSLGWFTWGRMVMPFQEACWNLEVDELSQPVETSFGVHLIKLTGRRQIEVRPSFEDAREQVEASLRRALQQEIAEAGMAFTEGLRERYHLVIPDETVNELTTAMNTSKDEEHLYVRNIMEKLVESGWAGRSVAHWDGGELGMEELAEWCVQFSSPRTPFESNEDVREILSNAALFPLLEMRAREDGLDQDEELLEQVQKQIDGVVLTAYRNEVLSPDSGISDEDVAAYYNEHPDDYMDPAKVRVQEVYLKDKEQAERVAREAKSGANFSALARKHTARPGKAGTDGALEPFAAGRYGKMGEAAFQMSPGEISDPIVLGRAWVVIKKVEDIPPMPRPLEQCKTQIRMKLEREARDQANAEWRENAEREIGVKTWPEKLKRLFAED